MSILNRPTIVGRILSRYIERVTALNSHFKIVHIFVEMVIVIIQI